MSKEEWIDDLSVLNKRRKSEKSRRLQRVDACHKVTIYKFSIEASQFWVRKHSCSTCEYKERVAEPEIPSGVWWRRWDATVAATPTSTIKLTLSEKRLPLFEQSKNAMKTALSYVNSDTLDLSFVYFTPGVGIVTFHVCTALRKWWPCLVLCLATSPAKSWAPIATGIC